MSWRTNLVLFIVAVLLSAHLYFFENTAAPWQRLGKVFRELEPRDLYEVEIAKPAASADAALGVETRPIVIRKERRDGMPEAWWIVSPITFPASHPRVQGIAFLIADLTRVAEVPAAAGAASSEQPALVVRFKTRTGEQETIEVLRDHPDAQLDLSYVRVHGEVFVTSKEFRKIAQAALSDLRSRALCPIPAQEAVFFSITAPGRKPR